MFLKIIKSTLSVFLLARPDINILRSFASTMECSSVVRLGSVSGEAGKCNDILFASKANFARSNVVFFGGDMQNYEEFMKDEKYSKWGLEHTADLLSKRFPESNVWVVKPSAMQENTYSLYSNFVVSGKYGIPSHSIGQRSWNHLYLLMKHSLKSFQPNHLQPGTSFLDSPLIIIGFSKGCVVLNQLVYDLSNIDSDDLKTFVSQVHMMYFLDGGHSGTRNTWVTDENLLKVIPKMGINIETHVTPYQIEDKSRPWIALEYKTFTEKLKECGAIINTNVHFSGSGRSLDCHFSILERF